MLPTSIRWRIQAWHGFLLACIVSGLIVGFYKYERRVRFRDLDSRLHQYISPLLPELGGRAGRPGGPGPEGRRRGPPPMDEAEGQLEERPQGRFRPERGGAPIFEQLQLAGFYYAAWSPDGELTAVSTNAPAAIPNPERARLGFANPLRDRDEFRELFHHVPSGHVVLLGASTATIQKELTHLAGWLTVAGIGVIGIGVAGGWWMTNRAIRPLGAITHAAKKIAAGDLSKRIEVEANEGELGQLAVVLNHTFDRLEKSFEQQVQFTADASHELRTPISVMLTQIQLALSRDRTPPEYQQTLRTCERAVERMRILVNQLLELARIDSGDVELLREECDLGRVVREALEFIEPLAKQNQVTLRPSIESVRVSADAMKLGQVLINLLNNAIQHNQNGIEVRVSLRRNDTHALLRVADNGSGIPRDALGNLFDRFYRVEKSRSRVKGSTGLGLAICKAIVEAHGGSIKVESKQGFGSEFTVELPLVASAVS